MNHPPHGEGNMKLFNMNIEKASKKPENRLLQNLFWTWLQGREWAKVTDDDSLVNAYRSWVYVCASKNASSFASIPFGIYAARASGEKQYGIQTRAVKSHKQETLFSRLSGNPIVRKAEEFVEVLEHPVLDVLQRVNQFENRYGLFETTLLWQELTGNAYWYILKDGMGVPVELWPMAPNRTTIVPSREKFIEYYVFRNGMEKVRFETEEVIHFKYPNPRDPYYGMSPLQAIADVYNINQNMNIFENALFSNNARPEGFFTTEHEVDPVDYDRLSSELLETWTGIKNTGKTGLLTHGLKFESVNLPPREIGFLQGRKWTKEEIFNAFSIPLGLMDNTTNRANAEAAQFVYMKYGIEPRIKRFEEKLNEILLPMFDERLFICFENVVPEDREFELKEDTALFGIGAKSANEIRRGRGLDAYEGGDSLYAPFSLTVIGTTSGGKPAPQPVGNEEEEEEEVEEMAGEIARKVANALVGIDR